MNISGFWPRSRLPHKNHYVNLGHLTTIAPLLRALLPEGEPHVIEADPLASGNRMHRPQRAERMTDRRPEWLRWSMGIGTTGPSTTNG